MQLCTGATSQSYGLSWRFVSLFLIHYPVYSSTCMGYDNWHMKSKRSSWFRLPCESNTLTLLRCSSFSAIFVSNILFIYTFSSSLWMLLRLCFSYIFQYCFIWLNMPGWVHSVLMFSAYSKRRSTAMVTSSTSLVMMSIDCLLPAVD